MCRSPLITGTMILVFDSHKRASELPSIASDVLSDKLPIAEAAVSNPILQSKTTMANLWLLNSDCDWVGPTSCPFP